MEIPKALFFKAFGTRLAGAEGLEPSARGFGGLGSSLKNKGLQAFLRHFDDTDCYTVKSAYN